MSEGLAGLVYDRFPELARDIVRSVGLATIDAVGCMGACCLCIGSNGWLGLWICFAAVCKLLMVFSAMGFTAVGTEYATEGTGLCIRAMTKPPTVLAEGEDSDLLCRHDAKMVMAIHKRLLGEVLH